MYTKKGHIVKIIWHSLESRIMCGLLIKYRQKYEKFMIITIVSITP